VIVIGSAPVVHVSAKTGCGVEALGAALLRCLGLDVNPANDRRAAIFDLPMRVRLAQYVEQPPSDPVADCAALVAAITGTEAAD
jgi:hypothetical protein